jgi:hypothetical protein
MSRTSYLDFQDYLDAAGDAAKRTRTVTILLVVASVLTFVGWLNSLPDGWIAERLKTLSNAGVALTKEPDALDREDMKSLDYLKEKIGPRPTRYKDEKDQKNNVETKQYQQYKDQYKELYIALVRTYVDNTFTIRVPFFGISFDINYLGLLSGLGLVIVLILFRFTITRELQNLELSLEEARKRTSLWEFYHLVAMRQVLTIPPMETKRQSRFRSFIQELSAFIPKVICFLPLVVYAAVTYNDYRTSPAVGQKISESLTNSTLYKDYFFLLCILLLTIECYRRWGQVDRVWRDYWSKAKNEKAKSDQWSAALGGRASHE